MFEHLESMFEKKNSDYGNSFSKFGQICHVLFPDGIKLESEEDFVKFGLFSNILTKLNRLANLEFNKKGDSNFESISDTCDDLSVYSQILKQETKKGQL